MNKSIQISRNEFIISQLFFLNRFVINFKLCCNKFWGSNQLYRSKSFTLFIGPICVADGSYSFPLRLQCVKIRPKWVFLQTHFLLLELQMFVNNLSFFHSCQTSFHILLLKKLFESLFLKIFHQPQAVWTAFNIL